MTAYDDDDGADELPGRDEINETTDIGLLEEWLDEAEDIKASIKAQYSSFEEMGVLRENWARRAAGKLYYARLAADRIARRLHKLRGSDA